MLKNEIFTVVQEGMTIEIALKDAKELGEIDNKIFSALAYASMEETAEKKLNLDEKVNAFANRLIELCTLAGDPIPRNFMYVCPGDTFIKLGEISKGHRLWFLMKSTKDNNYYKAVVF
jgi:hypothetical protein